MSDEEPTAIDRVRYVLLQRNINALHQAAEQDRRQLAQVAETLLRLQQTITMQAQTIQRLEQLFAVAAATAARGR